MKYLVDANVLSEATKPAPDPKVVAWLEANEAGIVIDAIVLGELSAGILALPAGRKRQRLAHWFESVVQAIDCIPWDAAIGLRWAKLLIELRKRGTPLPVLDSMIAATALRHGLTVVTRNTRDFARAGVAVVDPFI